MQKLSTLHALMFPSLSESFGIAIVEAMSVGLPVVASNVGGIPDIVDDGRNGILVPPGDPESLAGAVQALFDDAATYSKLSDAARATVLASFTEERMLESYSELLMVAVKAR